MSAENAVRSVASVVLLLIGIVLLIAAAFDLLEGFGLVYCLFLAVIGVVFLAVSGRV